ncbi:MAG: BatA and WFA domain-containing protein, partial [Lentisphaeria bacterium]|nr:BatA and WFA domain-containing protein [Lentisphaeria bacterium]
MPVFTHPLFLFGALAAAVPLVLHLMNRQLPRRQLFPSIRFLRSARLPREGRRRLRDVALLILRMLALVCLAVALARPVRPPAPGTAASDSREVVILLDASASMAGFGSAQRAREQLDALLAELPRSARVGLLLSAREPLLRLPLDSDRAELLRALADYVPTKQAAEHRRALREAARMFTGPGGLLVLVSDFQRPDWQVSEPLDLPPETEIRFLPTAPDARRNAGIVAVDTVPLGDDTQRVVVTVRNFATAPDQRQVKLGDGDGEQARAVELPPLQNRRVAFVVRQQATELVVRLEADDYPLDDTFHAWTGARAPLPVVAVVGGERDLAPANAALFLRQALELPDETSPVQFRVEELERRFLFTSELGATRLLVILGVGGQCEEAEFGKIKEYLAGGGTVLWTPSPSAAREFQQLWRHELLRARFIGLAGEHEADSFGLGWVNPETPLGQVFSRPETTDLYLFPVRRYARFEPPANATVWLRFLAGDPALVDV